MEVTTDRYHKFRYPKFFSNPESYMANSQGLLVESQT